MTGVTITLYQDTRMKKKNGKFPVKILVTHRRIQRLFSTTVDLTVNEFNMLHASNKTYNTLEGDTLSRKELKDNLDILNEVEKKAKGIINGLSTFTFPKFKTEFQDRRSEKGSVFSLYEDHILKLKNNGDIGTAVWYSCSMNSVKSYRGKLQFKQVTADFLNNYEKWMLQNERSVTSVSMYTRALRAMFNRAIKANLISQEFYPFGDEDDKYQIPVSKNIKKALPINLIGRIYDYPAIERSSEDKARDFWYFTYLCNGINSTDIAFLKFKNLYKNEIIFYRKKTIKAKKADPVEIKATLNEDLEFIISKWGNKSNLQDNYIFPILKPNCSPTQNRNAIQQFTKTTNKYMKRIAASVGIEINLTTYVARHSFGTIMKRGGASEELISELYGHGSVKTTRNYLGSFESEVRSGQSESLTAFKNSGKK